MREKLWYLLDEMRLNYNYLQEYRQHLDGLRIKLSILTGAIALLSISMTQLTENFGILWQLTLLAAGLINIIYDRLMIADKLAALKYFIPELNQQVDAIDLDWLYINEQYECADAYVSELYRKHKLAYSTLNTKYLDSLHLPEHEKSLARAKKTTKYHAERFS